MNWQKFGTVTFKFVVIVLAYWFLIKKLISFENWNEMLFQLKAEPWRFIRLGSPVLLLTLLNITLRSLVWKNLVSIIQPISFKRSVRAILLGITGGSFTPAKVGDWVGKAIVLSPEYRKKGFFVAGFGHFIQNFSMVIPGIIALYFYTLSYSGVSEFVSKLSFNLLWILEACIVLAVIALPIIAKRINIPLLPGKIKGLIGIIASYKTKTYFSIVWLNFVKNFFIYVQLFLLLKLYGIEISISEALVIIPTFYLSLTFIPGIMFADLGVIGAFGVAVIGSVFPNLAAVVLATMTIWMTNVALPLLTGSVLIAIFKRRNRIQAEGVGIKKSEA